MTFQLDFTFSEIDMSCLVGGSILGLEVIKKSLKILLFHFGFGALKIYDLNHMVDIQHPQQHHQDHLDAGLFGGDQVDSFIIKNIIIKTRPKPAYGRQDLAGSWGSG